MLTAFIIICVVAALSLTCNQIQYYEYKKLEKRCIDAEMWIDPIAWEETEC